MSALTALIHEQKLPGGYTRVVACKLIQNTLCRCSGVDLAMYYLWSIF